MRIFKPLRLGLLTKTVPHNGGGLFVISTLSLFDLQDPGDILAETALWPMAAKELPKGAILDAAYPKPSGEFLIAGRAMSAQPVQAMHVGVSVGDNTRGLSVFGDRRWQVGADGPVFSQPAPFTEMPLTPERAFGGEGYAANPIGCGASSADLQGHVTDLPLPNVELSGSEIRTITDCPQPALVGPIAMDDPARMKLTGTFDRSWVSQKMPEWPDDFDPRYYMCAPYAQRFGSYFTGDEPLRVVGMSARAPDVQSNLPGLRVRAFVARAGAGTRLTEVPMHTDTVWIFGSELKGVVVNRGLFAVSDRDGVEISDLMIAYEWLRHDPRPAEHYQHVYNLRSDPEEGYKYLLADGQLSPEEDPEEVARREQARLAEAEARQAKWLESRQWRLERQFAEHGLPAFMVPPPGDQDVKPLIMPSKEDIERGDVDFARLISDAEDLSREAELKSGMVFSEIQGITRQIGVRAPDIPGASLEEMERLNRLSGTGKGFLPAVVDLVPNEGLDQLLETFEQAAPETKAPDETDPQEAFEAARDRFLTSPSAGLLAGAKNMLEDPSTSPSDADGSNVQTSVSPAGVERESDTDLEANDPGSPLDAYLLQAFPGLVGDSDVSPSTQLQMALGGTRSASASTEDGPAAARDQLASTEEKLDDALVSIRRTGGEAIAPLEPVGPLAAGLFGEFLRSHLVGGGALSGRDMAGASLASLVAVGADLSGSFLEKCDLTGAQLSEARADNTVFTGADLTVADLSGADLSQANLSKVKAVGASFAGARFLNSTVIGADFSGCDLSGAHLQNCTFVDCKLDGALLKGAGISECAFLNCDLSDISAGKARLQKTSFLSCELERTDWSEAVLKKVSFANVTFRKSNLSKTDLEECGWFGPTEMAGTDFSHSKAVKCGFQDARMQETAFLRAMFSECNFASADLEAADMRLSSWKSSMFAFASLRGADLFGANLLGASFHSADLARSSFRSANLYRADLSEASLTFADFTGSNFDLSSMEAKV